MSMSAEMKKNQIYFSPAVNGGKRAWVPNSLINENLKTVFYSLSHGRNCKTISHESWEFSSVSFLAIREYCEKNRIAFFLEVPDSYLKCTGIHFKPHKTVQG